MYMHSTSTKGQKWETVAEEGDTDVGIQSPKAGTNRVFGPYAHVNRLWPNSTHWAKKKSFGFFADIYTLFTIYCSFKFLRINKKFMYFSLLI
jgi:hypothetical protein